MHRGSLIAANSEAVCSNPNKLWSALSKDSRKDPPSQIPLLSWIEHYQNEFSPPDSQLQDGFKTRLDDFFFRVQEVLVLLLRRL